jgi:hypothetical protein
LTKYKQTNKQKTASTGSGNARHCPVSSVVVLFECTTKSLSATVLGEFVAAQHLVRRKEKKGMKDVKGKRVKNRVAEIEKKERTRNYKNKYHRKEIRMEDISTKGEGTDMEFREEITNLKLLYAFLSLQNN